MPSGSIPANSDHVLIGNDGGLAVSFDQAQKWEFFPNLPVGLFYHVSVDNAVPYNICGGMQDNYNWCGPSQVRGAAGIAELPLVDAARAATASSCCRIRPTTASPSANRRTATSSASIASPARRWASGRSPRPANRRRASIGTRRWRCRPTIRKSSSPAPTGCTAPAIAACPGPPISPDLSKNQNRDEIETMGMKNSDIRIARNDGIVAWGTIVSFAESPKRAGVLYTGSDDGNLHVSRDGGKDWASVSDRIPNLPKETFVSEVVPSRFDEATVYATFDGHRNNDFETYIYASTDYGQNWRSISANLKGEVVRTLIEDQKNPDVLYLGTETGLFVTIDRGRSWQRIKANLPTVRIDEIALHPRDNAMILGTHGRVIWVLDNMSPIQEYAAAQAATADAKLFAPAPAAMYRRPARDRNYEFWGDQIFYGENPPQAAVITWLLKKPAGEVALRITDAAGKAVREISGPVLANSNKAGIQSACWDLRVQPVPAPAGAGGDAAAVAAGRWRRGRTGRTRRRADQPPDPFGAGCGGGGGGFGGGFGFGGGGESRPLRAAGCLQRVADRRRQVDRDAAASRHGRSGSVADRGRTQADVRDGDGDARSPEARERRQQRVHGRQPPDSRHPEDHGRAQRSSRRREIELRIGRQVAARDDREAGATGRRSRRRGRRRAAGGGRGGAADSPIARLAQAKNGLMGGMPATAQTLDAYKRAKTEVPKTLEEAQALLSQLQTLSTSLAKHNITLTVPPAVLAKPAPNQ